MRTFMRKRTVAWVGILWSIVAAIGAVRVIGAAGDPAKSGRIREAAARNLALFQASQKHWFEVQRCDSCHHQYQPAIAYRSAREHGIPFDEGIARADAAKAFTYADLDKFVQYSWVLEPAVDDAYRMIAADAAGVRPSLSTAVMARVLMARQTMEYTDRGGKVNGATLWDVAGLPVRYNRYSGSDYQTLEHDEWDMTLSPQDR